MIKGVKINGPINVVRLEGQVENIPKVVYIFFDIHLDLDEQTECDDPFSQDVNKYLIESFYQFNRGEQFYDFFLEIFPGELKSSIILPTREKYIEELVKLFRKFFRYNPKTNKISINEMFQKVRLHYIDTRNFYFNMEKLDHIGHLLRNKCDSTLICLQNIYIILKEFQNYFVNILNIIKHQYPTVTKIKIIGNENIIDSIKYVFHKIREKYKHKQIKNIINSLLQNEIQNLSKLASDLEYIIQEVDEYIKYISKINNHLYYDEDLSRYSYGLTEVKILQILGKINSKIDYFSYNYLYIFSRIMDLYALRRILDKDYITHAIIYSGASHSINYVFNLIKYFNFTITHAAYSKIKNLKKLNLEISKRSVPNLEELLWPPYPIQCSDISGDRKSVV